MAAPLTLAAQRLPGVGRPPADTTRQPPADSTGASAVPLPQRDSVVAPDTVKAPIVAAERVRSLEAGTRRYVWNREEIFRTGAVTLTDLLATVPGVQISNAAYLAAPAVAHWYGQPGRVRIYLDGLELDGLDPRDRGVADIANIPLWAMEEVAVERAAGELRVHLTSWRVTLTTPQTRTDIYSGADNTNLYRGFYGKRFRNGGVLQLAAQQFSTTNFAYRGDGDALSAFARVGVAKENWGVDFVAVRAAMTRNPTRRFIRTTPDDDAIPSFKGRDVTAYLRATWRDPSRDGLWAQVLAGTLQYIESDSAAAASTTTPDLDTVSVRAQYVGTVGYSRGPLRVSGTTRLRAGDGRTRLAPSLRGSYDTERLSLSGFAEFAGPDSTTRVDIASRFKVLPWLYLAAAHSQHAPDATLSLPTRSTTRADVALTWRQRWLSVGVVQRGEAFVDGLPLFDPNFVPATLSAATGIELALAGPIWGPFSFDWRGTSWGKEDIYRSSVESHLEIRVETSLAKRLPRANFHMLAAVTHDYRNDYLAPDGGGGVLRGRSANSLGTILDLRIGAAHVFFYNRNMTGAVFETAPGYLMPRLVQFYGIRWEFWN